MKSYFFTFILTLLFLASTFTASFAQINWERDASNPVMTPGPPGAWDEGFVQHSSVVFDGNEYHMWYHAQSAIPGDKSIGHATSQFGIFWIKDTLNNPVLTKGSVGSWDEYYVFSPSVVYDGSIFHMWYSGLDQNEINIRIGYAWSSDGVNWQKYNDPTTPNPPFAESDPVLIPGSPGRWDEGAVEVPAVILEGNSYTMWYTGWDNSEISGIGRATSTNGFNWTKDSPNNPVLNRDSSVSWDYPVIRANSVVFDGTAYHLFYYAGIYYVNWRIGYAWSSNGVNWQKYNDSTTTHPLFDLSDPVLTWGQEGSWDDTQVGAPWVILDTLNSTFRMWYTGADAVNAPITGIGYATAPVTALEEINSVHYPEGFALKQNYPNPFNPSTTIEFSIPKAELVTLKIYNILGQEVITLVSKKLSPGNYKYTWDATGFVNGVYYYLIKAGKFHNEKKMVLIK